MPRPPTVLVADDDPDLRVLVRAVLENAGLSVIEEAIDGVAALDAIGRLDPPPIPTVMVLDHIMPGLSGLEVAEQVLARHPGQRIVLFSSYLDDHVERRAGEIGITRCVSKPDLHRLPSILKELAEQAP